MKKLLLPALCAFAASLFISSAGAQPVPFGPFSMQFTNAATNYAVCTNIANFNATNTLVFCTSGVPNIITSAPIALYRNRGFSLNTSFATTNTTATNRLTNVVMIYDLSPDGTNWTIQGTNSTAPNWPYFIWFITPPVGSNYFGKGVYTMMTNTVTEGAYDNYKYIRLHTIWVTNGDLGYGGIFFTNVFTNNTMPALTVFP